MDLGKEHEARALHGEVYRTALGIRAQHHQHPRKTHYEAIDR